MKGMYKDAGNKTYVCRDPLLFREFNASRGIIVTDRNEKIVYCNGDPYYDLEICARIMKASMLLRKGC